MPPPPAATTTAPVCRRASMAGCSTISIGSGEGTTRRQPRPASSRITQPWPSMRRRASVSSKKLPIGLEGERNAGSPASTRVRVTTVTVRRATRAWRKALSRHCWSMKPMPPWVSATQVSRGRRGSRSAARSLRSRTLPTWGPLPWVTTSGRAVRWARCSAVSRVRSYWAGMGLALPGGEMAFPPRATTTSCSRTRSSHQVTAGAPLRRRNSKAISRGDSPEGEPAGQLGLDRQVPAQGRLDPQLQLVVAALAVQGRERVEGAPLVQVDQVEPPPALVLEPEHRAQQLGAEAVLLQGRVDQVGAGDQVLHLRVGQHHPAVAVAVVGHRQGGSGLGHGQGQQLLELRGGGLEALPGGG